MAFRHPPTRLFTGRFILTHGVAMMSVMVDK